MNRLLHILLLSLLSLLSFGQETENYVQTSVRGNDGDTPQYHYYLKDHQGNNRVVVEARSGRQEQVNHYYPYGGLMAESMSGEVNRYKYNGKELDRMHGLDWMDYGARWMDGMRFTTPDPLAGKYPCISPYAYCADNPVMYVDPDGRKKHKWIREKVAAPKKNYENRFGKPFVQIWAHGKIDEETGKAKGIIADISYVDTKRSKTPKKPFYEEIKTASRLNDILKMFDKDWKNRSKNGQAIIILHSCATSELAKSFSKDECFKDVIFIAPNNKLLSSEEKFVL